MPPNTMLRIHPLDASIAELESPPGYKIRRSYIELANTQNGGSPKTHAALPIPQRRGFRGSHCNNGYLLDRQTCPLSHSIVQ